MGLSVGVSSAHTLLTRYSMCDSGSILLSSSLGLELCLLFGKCEFADQIGACGLCLVSDPESLLHAHSFGQNTNAWSVKIAVH